jgi:hypothetical protein
LTLPELRVDPSDYLLDQSEPWVAYNTLVNLLGRSPGDPEVAEQKRSLVEHERVIGLVEECLGWPGEPLKRHNDASHVIHKMGLLADFGMTIDDAGIGEIVDRVLQHRSDEGSLQSNLLIPKHFGGSGEPSMEWMLCDAPILLHSLLSMGVDVSRVEGAVRHLVSVVDENGWRCRGSTGMRGPGRKDDHCPYANLVSLKALSLVPSLLDSEACRRGIEAQLSHWENRAGRKIYMFGIGSTFSKLKYPNVWYDILHVVDVLSRFSYAREDARFREMLEAVYAKQRDEGFFVPESVFRAWKGWSFGQKKGPCPWLTYRVALISRRVSES